MASKAVPVCTLRLPPGAAALSAGQWEEKRRALDAFCRQLFAPANGKPDTATTSAANGAAELSSSMTVTADVPARWEAPPGRSGPAEARRYLVGTEKTEYPEKFAVRMGPSPIHGRGMFATKDFVQSEIVEVCPTLEVNQRCIGGKLEDYVYYGDKKDRRVIVMGYGMMYNSWKNANLWYYRDDNKNFVFVATRAIEEGEELCIDYGPEWWGSRDNKEQLLPVD
eukprot:EG_transcript_24862